MIIWIDGALGIGKTTIAQKLIQKHLPGKAEFLDSDEYFYKICDKNPKIAFCSWLPNDNIPFIHLFRDVIEEKTSDTNKDLVVAMALIREPGKLELLDYLIKQNIPILHIILTADRDVIKSRIESDSDRDHRTALISLDDSIKFLEDNFHDAVWIDTGISKEDAVTNQIFYAYLQFKKALAKS